MYLGPSVYTFDPMIEVNWATISASAQAVPRLVNPPVLIPSQVTARTILEYRPAAMKHAVVIDCLYSTTK
jgi:hypothetical protein